MSDVKDIELEFLPWAAPTQEQIDQFYALSPAKQQAMLRKMVKDAEESDVIEGLSVQDIIKESKAELRDGI